MVSSPFNAIISLSVIILNVKEPDDSHMLLDAYMKAAKRVSEVGPEKIWKEKASLLWLTRRPHLKESVMEEEEEDIFFVMIDF